jgi:hypothetical protein
MLQRRGNRQPLDRWIQLNYARSYVTWVGCAEKLLQIEMGRAGLERASGGLRVDASASRGLALAPRMALLSQVFLANVRAVWGQLVDPPLTQRLAPEDNRGTGFVAAVRRKHGRAAEPRHRRSPMIRDGSHRRIS